MSKHYNHELWPSPRARVFAMALEKKGYIKKPVGLRRWTHETALSALSRYVEGDRSKLLETPMEEFVKLIPSCGIGIRYTSCYRRYRIYITA